jgi:hypothetical protein
MAQDDTQFDDGRFDDDGIDGGQVDDGRVAARTPVHLWIVGVLALLWNMIGVTDYVMMRTRNADYFRAVMPDLNIADALAYMDSMSLLASTGWALGVWGAMAGTLLLLMRSRHAVLAYLVSLVGAVIAFVLQFTGPIPPPGMDDPVVPIIVTGIAIALLLYARRMRSRGVLR